MMYHMQGRVPKKEMKTTLQDYQHFRQTNFFSQPALTLGYGFEEAWL